MNASMWKTTIREIKKSLGRYLAILAIVALGVGFFAGLHVMKAAMLTTANDFFEKQAFFDFHLMSTLGFDEEDLKEIQEMPEVRTATGAKETDFIALNQEGAEDILRAYSITADVNQLILKEGNMPKGEGESVVDVELFWYEIGDTFTIAETNSEDTINKFVNQTYTVVGKVQSPLFINYERGNTSLGSGTIMGYAYFDDKEFDIEDYTDIYLKYNSDYMIYSPEYKDFAEQKEKQIEELCDSRKDIRYGNVLNKANDSIKEGEEELADAKLKLADAKQELEEARIKIEDGKEELTEKEQELKDAQLEIANAKQDIIKGKQEIIDGEKELEDGIAEYEKGEIDLLEGREQLAEAIPKVQRGRLTYEENLKLWKDGMKQLAQAKDMLDKSAGQLQVGWKQYQEGVMALGILKNLNLHTLGGYSLVLVKYQALLLQATLTEPEKNELATLSQVIPIIVQTLNTQGITNPSDTDLDAIVTPLLTGMDNTLIQSNTQLTEAQAQYDAGLLQYTEGMKPLEEAKVTLDYALTQVEKGEKELAEAGKKIEDGQKELDEAKAEIENAKKELENGKKELADGEKKLSDASEKVADGLIKIEDAKKELADGEIEYLDGKKEYEEAKTDADIEIADAEKKMAEAKVDISKLKKPEYYVLGRDTNVGYATYEGNANIIEGISAVFPVFFLLVAALVCMTTMNRMVEEQRTQIGVLKALGYSGSVIMGKYMVYSGSAAFLGCVVGFVAGSYVFPIVIWEAYSMMYSFVDRLNFIFNTPLLLLSIAVSLVCALGTTYLSCRYELTSVAAELMRPKAPKNGKRIFLERIPFLWNRLNFLYKVSIRNVVRYKKRFFMMVFGISGCSALLVTGYGIKDSIVNVTSGQFQEVFRYDISVSLQEEFDDKEKADFQEETRDLLSNYAYISEASCKVEQNGTQVTATMVMPQNPEEIQEFVRLYQENGENINYPKEGEVVLSKKAAERLELQIGDTLIMWDSDKAKKMELKLTGITENFLNNYAYIHADSYTKGFSEEVIYKTIYAKALQKEQTIQVAGALLELDHIASAMANAVTEERFSGMISSMDYVVLLVIVCAGALAFIVLYNLTNINITERIREIATIKVLGFYPMETASYVFRENLVLAAIGALVGLPLGFLLHRFVLLKIVIDDITFVKQVQPVSYVYSILFTFLFAIIVNIFMFFKLQKINMAESLKSIE